MSRMTLIQGLIDASSDDDDGDENEAIEGILSFADPREFMTIDEGVENEIRTRSLEEANEWDNYESHISEECEPEW